MLHPCVSSPHSTPLSTRRRAKAMAAAVPPRLMPLSLATIAVIFFLACSGSSQALPGSPEPANDAGSSAADRHALLAFRSLVRSDPSQALASWRNNSSDISPCKWHGVSCGARGSRRGRVVALDLPGLGILGALTPALGNLTRLRRLHLPGNRLHGSLPRELGRLRELIHLNLSRNSIDGSIPQSLSRCKELKRVLLHTNKLQGQIPPRLFGALRRSLEVLDLGQNRLTGSIPPDIGSLVNLKLLDVESNNLTGEIPWQIGNLVSLVRLGLGSNQLSGSIPNSFRNLSALTALRASSNKLSGSIPPLQNLASLSALDLGQNNLGGTIPSWLGNLSSLMSLNLQSNGLVGRIPESIGNLQLLTAVSFAENRLVGPIPDAIGNLHALAELYLDNNELEGPLPLSIFNLSSLEMLNIQSNNLTGEFPLDMGNTMTNLQEFLVSKNQFHGVIPPSLCNASMLQRIQTVDNFLSGTIPGCLGARQEMLYAVNFVGNQLEATDDADWGFLTSLTNCSNMILLDVSINRLQGVLPKSIGNLSTQMTYLGISTNSIRGTITEAIGNLINLDELDMDNNLLEGTIPASLGKLEKLNHLDLSNNNLSGSIPVGIGNLTKLTILFLSTNKLSGTIPSGISNCPLEAFDLSYNHLSGPMPKELFLISTLSSFMYLAHNSLSGTFPSETGNLKNLAELDISGNMISGKIPTTVGECQSLQYLNVSGNFLDGTIPLSLGQLRGLLVLDLSQNNLSGRIPNFLCSMKGLASLNLSFNHFEGEVPKDGIFRNATATSIKGNDALCGGVPQLKLKTCSSLTKRNISSKFVITIIAVGSAILLIILSVLFMLCRRNKLRRTNTQTPLSNEKHMRVSYAELAKATDGFTSENLIGVGSFGAVYKGRMEISGQQVVIAVKVLNLQQAGASRSFDAECEALRCIRHRNLVKVITVCSSIDPRGADFKALVFEFLPNGNLDQWLHEHPEEDGEPKVLDLIERLQIAMDVASALDYLHHHKPFPIVHCDLKPSNILLDNDMVAHVGDFGLARFLHEEQSDKLETPTSRNAIRGTIGYVAPEYGLGNEASIHGDVYSYGILLLEMFTGKRPTSSEFGDVLSLHRHVQMALPHQAANVIDQDLLKGPSNGKGTAGDYHKTEDCIISILQVGIACLKETPTDRIQIGDALRKLQATKDTFYMHE